MRTLTILAFPLLVLLVPGCGGEEEPVAQLEDLVLAERAFARASLDHGMREAFLTAFAEDGIIFRPLPVNGRNWFGEREAIEGSLAWAPAWAEISQDGSLGYTCGPWEYRADPDDREPSGTGYYFSVWRCASGGEWRVAVDIGNTCPLPEGVDLNILQWQAVGSDRSPLRDRSAPPLPDLDRPAPFSEDPAELLALASPDLMLIRPGSPPVSGAAAAERLLAGEGWVYQRRPGGSGMAASRDLAYTYGTILEGKDAEETGGYLRVWRREASGAWKIAVDAALPTSPPKKLPEG